MFDAIHVMKSGPQKIVIANHVATFYLLVFLCVNTILINSSLYAQESEDQSNMIQFRLCGDIYIQQERRSEKLSLTSNEEKLVCGDNKTPAWQNIPFNQAIYFLKTFLQSRGYHDVETLVRDQKLYVTLGPATRISKVITDGLPEPIDVTRYWPIFGRKLTPANLDELEKWLLQELGHKGYACAQLEITGNPKTGDVTVTASNAVKSIFPPIDSNGISGLIGGVERRYDAFQTGDLYDSLLLDLSVARMLRDDIVLNTLFQTNCNADRTDISIKQTITSGEPRLISFGFGFDTENFFIAQASWKNTRFGSMGSKIETIAYVSYREQRASLLFDWYYAPIVINHFLRSTLEFTRERRTQFDSRTITAESGPAWNIDRIGHRFFTWVRPSYELVETEWGKAPSTTQILSFKGTLEMESHAHEYYAQQPQTGHEVRLNYAATRKDMASDISANRYQLDATKLWNLFDYSPAIWILGLRLSAATTTTLGETARNDLPPGYRYFLGGSQNMRGFGLEKLPTDSSGALSMAYLGLESRVANTLPLGLQPIIFTDFSRLSASSFTLDQTWFWSPGAGINWASPIGTFRLTLAHGFVEDEGAQNLDYLSRWQFYLSYGEQF